jgi:hypothetical protein
MKQIFLFLFFIFLVNGISASSFSPSSLIFELTPGEQDCKTISVSSDSEVISVSDVWAENKDVEWKINLFQSSAESLGININYLSEISSEQGEVKVCVSGINQGEYHGAIILKEEQQGNSIVQMGVWLKLTISEVKENTQNSNSGGNSGSSGSSSSSGSSGGNLELQDSEDEEESLKGELEELENQEIKDSLITGGVIGGIKTKNILFSVIIIGSVLIALFLVRRRK